MIEQVREAADIVAIIGEYVPLKKTGSDYRGPCPFHQGTRRNFSVVPAKRLYHCFVCGESGDVFKFLHEATRRRMAGSGPHGRRESGHRRSRDTSPARRTRSARAALGTAGDRCRVLPEDAVGRQRRRAGARVSRRARRLPRGRRGFRIGFAPREIGLMRGYMNALGFDDARLLEGGLMVQADQDSEPRPRFSGRLMFPILDAMGRNVGFGGRLLGPGEPKYLNSSESPIFSKGKLLCGFESVAQPDSARRPGADCRRLLRCASADDRRNRRSCRAARNCADRSAGRRCSRNTRRTSSCSTTATLRA